MMSSLNAVSTSEEATREPVPVLDMLWTGAFGAIAVIVGLSAIAMLVRMPAGEGVLRPFIAFAAGVAAVAVGVIWLADAIGQGPEGAPGMLGAAERAIAADPVGGLLGALVWAVGLALAGAASIFLALIRLARSRRAAARPAPGRPA